jgi:2-keto-4-pentenoate hydratase/2-oxohepta-3-ene-1,7-dioic acid hydratase in catechol pathway
MSQALPRPSKIVCIGRNYAAHARELNNEIPSAPVVFLKPPSSLVASGGTVELPPQSNDVHHEVELVVEIGTRCRYVAATEAIGAVSAYAVGLDMTARDVQSAAKQKGLPWTVAKGFDTFCPIGDRLSADSVEPTNLQIELAINGEIRQRGSTSLMLFPAAELIAYCSTVFTLEPGDLIFTGTPSGVGPVKEGDRLVASITGLPNLSVEVVRRHGDKSTGGSS